MIVTAALKTHKSQTQRVLINELKKFLIMIIIISF